MNCIVIDDDKLSRKIIEEYISKTEFLHLLGSYDNAIEALSKINNEIETHLVFLDIEMPEMTGIEFLNSLQKQPYIIIISSKEKYAIDAFEHDVIDYLLKPISFARFYKAVEKAHNRHYKENSKDGFFIKNGSTSLVRIDYADILWIEALENYVVVNNFDTKHTIHYTMKAILNRLPRDIFTRVHRSYIVNVKKINIIEDNNIIINTKSGKKTIPIAKSYKEKLMNYIDLVVK